MSIANAHHAGRTDLPSPWGRIWPRLTGTAIAILMVAGAGIVLLGDGYRTASLWAIDAADTRWISGMADGLPYRPPRGVRPNALYDWSLAPPDRVQIYTGVSAGSKHPSRMTLLLPSVEGNPTLFVNGVPTEASGTTGHRYLAYPASRSVAWEIPAAFLRPGRNRIDVVVAGPGRRSLAAPLVLGPLDTPAALHKTMNGLIQWFRTYLPPLSLAAAILALAAGAALRASTPWVAFAASAAAVGVRTLASEEAFQVRLGPFGPLFDQITLSAVLICLGCAFVNSRVPRSSRAGRVIGAGSTLFVGMIGISALGTYQGARGLEAAGLTLPFLGAAFLVWACADAVRTQPPLSIPAQGMDGWVLAMLALATTSAVGVGSGMAWGLWVLGLETVYGLSIFALLCTLATVSAVLATGDIWRWARDRPRLSRIIRSQREEIEATSLALEQQVKRSAVLEERQRLSRDMHDGIGGQLMSLLARVRSRRITTDQLEGELVNGLSELRLMVDSLDASDGSVADALAVLRSRIRTQTEAARMSLEWSQAGDLNVVADDPRWILNLNRLIQEAATNAVRHSNGDRIDVTIEATGDRRLTVTIEDDGVGFDRDLVPPGRGLSNLVFRAAQLGGRLEIDRVGAGGGTIVKAVVSLPHTPAQDDGPRDQSSGDMMPS